MEDGRIRVRRTKRIRTQAGVTLIESLAAALVIAVSLGALLSAFGISFTLDTRTRDVSFSYSMARSTIEQVRLQGFSNATEGPTTVYYNVDGTGPYTTKGVTARYQVVTTVTSDKFKTTGGKTYPADDSIRTVTVVVTNLQTNAVTTEGTELARAGI